MKKLHAYAITISSIAILLAGCGSGGTTPETKNVLDESAHCISCHDSSGKVTPGTGINVVTEWSRSTHMTANGANCSDCHDDGYLHSSSATSCSKCHTIIGQGNNPTINPDRDGKCAKCHGKINPRPGQLDGFKALTYPDPNIPIGSTTAYTHFSTGSHANYVATNYKQYCRKCHNPHDTDYGRNERKQWAESGHGSTTSPFRTGGTDFKTRGSAIPAKDNFGGYCVRCHTSTGYVNYIKPDPRNGQIFSNLQALPDLDGRQSNYPDATFIYQDKSRETTNCNVCHDDGRIDDESAYSGRLRSIGAFTGYFNYSTTPRHPRTNTNPANSKEGAWDVKHQQAYPDYGNSNICVVCHSGREIGKIIRLSGEKFNNYSNASNRAIFAHDRNAGSTLSGFSGFEFYTDPSMYANSKFLHNQINSTSTSGPNSGSNNGPCITCHMRNGSPHSFLPVQRVAPKDPSSVITAVVGNTLVCNSCHSWTAGTGTATDINLVKRGYLSALRALQKLVPRPGLPTVSTGAIGTIGATSSFTITGVRSISYSSTNWIKPFGNAVVPSLGGLKKGAYTLGAAYNLEMFLLDPGAYAHNPLYVKRLIYDSIDWLYDGVMNGDVLSALDYLKANASGIDATTYSEALAYLSKAGATLGERP